MTRLVLNRCVKCSEVAFSFAVLAVSTELVTIRIKRKKKDYFSIFQVFQIVKKSFLNLGGKEKNQI